MKAEETAMTTGAGLRSAAELSVSVVLSSPSHVISPAEQPTLSMLHIHTAMNASLARHSNSERSSKQHAKSKLKSQSSSSVKNGFKPHGRSDELSSSCCWQALHVASDEQAKLSSPHVAKKLPSFAAGGSVVASAASLVVVVAGGSVAEVVPSVVELTVGGSVSSDEYATAGCTSVVVVAARSRSTPDAKR